MLRSFLLGLVHAAVNGGSTAALTVIGATAIGTPLDYATLKVAAVGGAVVATIRHLQTSPIVQ